MKIKLNGHEIDFDVFDLENMAAYQDGCATVSEIYNQPPEEGKTAIDRLRTMCDATLEFFEGCLGAEQTRAVFGERLNVKTLAEAFSVFTTSVNAEMEQFGAKMTSGMNRAARRTQV